MSDIGTRAEHVAWCKARALQYVDEGDLNNAFASLISDLGKHSETAGARRRRAGHDAADGWAAEDGRRYARLHRRSPVMAAQR